MRVMLVNRVHQEHHVSAVKNCLQSAGHTIQLTQCSYEQAERSAFEAMPELVLIILSGNTFQVTELIHTIKAKCESRVVTIGPADDSRYILRTLQHGADYFIDQDEMAEELPRVLQRLYPQRINSITGSLLAVLGTTGGCGASTIGVNMAVLAAQQYGRSCLIDLHPQLGDLALMLDLKPAFTLQDVCINEARLDRALIEKMLAKHVSGVSVLASPASANVEYESPQAIMNAVHLCRGQFAKTVIDVGGLNQSLHREILQQATEVIVVCRASFNGLRRTRWTLEALSNIGINRDTIKLVANQCGQPNELPIDDMEQSLNAKIVARLNTDHETMNAANNTGCPVVLKEAESVIAQQLRALLFPKVETSPRLLQRMKSWLKQHTIEAVPTTPKNALTPSNTQKRFA